MYFSVWNCQIKLINLDLILSLKKCIFISEIELSIYSQLCIYTAKFKLEKEKKQ